MRIGAYSVRSRRPFGDANAASAQNIEKKRMSVLTYAIACDDDVDTASARTGTKERVRSDRMDSAADNADAQNIEDKNK